MTEKEAIRQIHLVSSLTHNHLRAKTACGLYFFMIREILNGEGNLTRRLQQGLNRGFAFYEKNSEDAGQLSYFKRMRKLTELQQTSRKNIRSSGYVIDTMEAAVWSLITTGSLKEALLLAVNLGDDTDTVGAIAGRPAGLYYGYEEIPDDWRKVIQGRTWMERMYQRKEENIWNLQSLFRNGIPARSTVGRG